MEYRYVFPAIKGRQANREYFVSMVPLKLLSKLFQSDEEVVQPEFRAQRKINETRIPEIKKYIIENRSSYVFSALSASIDGDFVFESIDQNKAIGSLIIDMNAVFLLNDGQHRKAALVEALEEDPELGKETISIVFFRDKGLKRSQQMFTDLNKHAIKTSNSLSTLYDSRDEIAVATKTVVSYVPFLEKYTDKERDILGKNSSKLFTLNTMYKAISKTLHKKCTNDDIAFLRAYWECITSNITEWNELENKEITKRDLKENYILTLAITITAFGKLGRVFYDNRELDFYQLLKKMRMIDWSRSNKEWRGRAIRDDGKVLNNEESINATYIKLKDLLGINVI